MIGLLSVARREPKIVGVFITISAVLGCASSEVEPSVQNLISDERIVGGREAEPHSLPYQLGLQIFTARGQLWCGASLISKSYVLTAAHCVERAYKVNVLIGAHDITKAEPERFTIEVSRSGITVHPGWNSQVVQNDVALIKLPNEIELNENIQIIKLPSKDQIGDAFIGEIATASGWGLTSDYSPTVAPRLRFIEVPIISRSQCVQYYGYNIQNSHICISGRGRKGACNGDSGGPLAIESGGEKIVVGIASFIGPSGCEAGWPTVYTRVTYFLDWILSKTGIALE